jgi:hypothetical protein
MVAYTLSQLRQTSPPEFQDLDDEDLVREYARINNVPFEQAADYYGVKPRGLLGEMGRQAAGGAMVDLPRMVGQGLRATGIAPELGEGLVRGAEERAYQYEADPRAERGLVGQALTLGARGLAPMVPALGAAFVPGGQVIAPTVAATLFGTSAYQDTYDKILEQTGDPIAAHEAGLRTGAIQGPLEGVATAVGLRAIRPVAAAMRGTPTTAGVAGAMTDTGVLRPFLRGQALNIPVQAGTEVAQDVGSELVERAYGGDPEAIDEIAKQSALGGAGIAFLLSPLGLGGSISRAGNARRLRDALDPESDVDPAFRSVAERLVVEEARRQGVDDADIGQWVNERIRMAVEAETQSALAAGAQVDLLDTGAQGDLFARGGERVEGLTRFDRTAEDFTQWQARPVDTTAAPPVLDLTQPGQQSLFDETGAPTYGADTSFGESRFEFEQGLQGPRITPEQRVVAGFPALNETLNQIQAGTLPRSTQVPLTPGQELALQGPARPVTGELTPGQQAAVAGPVATTPIQRALGGVSLDLEPATPVSTPSVSEPAGPSPVAAGATGVFSEQLVTRPDMPGFQFLPPQGETRGTQAPETQQAETQGQEASPTDLESLIERENNKAAGRNPLEASVEGAQGVRAPGRVSLTAPQIARITNAMTDPEQRGKRLPAKERKIVDALVKFAQTYKTYLDAGGNMIRSGQIIKRDTTAEEAVEARTQRAVDLGNDVRAALAELGQAVGGNAKDVDALVATVKAASQGRINSISDPTMVAAYKRLDAMLSQAWAASKAESFIQSLDPFYTRQEPTRAAREAKDQTNPFVRAAEGQQNPRGQGPTYKGFLGVLHYIRFYGTGYERMLARQIREALVNAKNIPEVRFVTEGNSRYDPVSNTVLLNQNASNSVVLHEGLHAALQWYVYQNPNNPAVKQLKASLKAVVNYKGSLGAKAKAVQDLLKKLVKEGNETDAVLELVSYGNTMNEFRKALEAMPRNTTPRSFYDAVTDIWQSALAIVKQLLGVDDSEAAAVFQSTWDLLAQIGESGQAAPPVRQGQVLEAAVMEGMDPLETPSEQLLRRPGAGQLTAADVEVYNRRILPTKLSTKVLFDMLGWDAVAKKITGGFDRVVDVVNTDFPGLARWITYIDARFSVPQDLKNTFQKFKNDRQAGYKVSERLATFVEFQPADKVTALFAYLDGDKNALKDDAATRELADDVKAWRDFYVQELGDPKAKEFFSRGKFSETMLFATRAEQVAGGTFGIRNLNKLLGQKEKTEPALEERWLNLNEQGDPILKDQRFFEVLKQQPDGTLRHEGFIAETKYKRDGAPAGFYVDPTYLWYHQSKGKSGHKFVANMTAAQAIQEKRADDLANALRNTMAALAGGYAAVQFSNSLASYERGTVNAVAFDSIEQINKLFDIKVNPDTVLNAGSQEARQKRTQHEFRTSNLWVRLPKEAKYGALGGKIIKASVWSAMNDMTDRRPVVDVRVINTSMRWFKKAKTIYNFGTHMTNIATNVSLSMLHDIPIQTVGAATRLFVLYDTAPNRLTQQERQIVRAFMNSNAMLGDFSSAEVKEALHDAMMKALKDSESPSLVGRIATLVGFERHKADEMKKLVGNKLERADQIATEIYSAEDNIFRLAAFMKFAADSAAQNGTPDLEGAGNFARDAFLDYDIDSKAVKVARQTVLPFVSWTYAIIPVLGRIAVHKPWQMANFMLAYMLIEHFMQEAAGGDEEDERLRKSGPEYIRDRMFDFGPYMHVRVPFLGDDQNPVYYRLGDYVPMATLARGLPNGFMGQDWWPSAVTPTGPFVSAVLAMVGGIDPFTGRPLSPPTDSQWEKLVDRSKYMAGQFLPNYPINPSQWKTTEEIIKGRTDKTENFAALQMARWAGLKFYDYNVQQSEISQFRAAKAIMSEYKQEMGRLRRAEARFENPDWDAFNKRQAELVERMLQDMAKARGEEE